VKNDDDDPTDRPVLCHRGVDTQVTVTICHDVIR